VRFRALEKLINLHDDYARQFKIDNLHLLLCRNFLFGMPKCGI